MKEDALEKWIEKFIKEDNEILDSIISKIKNNKKLEPYEVEYVKTYLKLIEIIKRKNNEAETKTH